MMTGAEGQKTIKVFLVDDNPADVRLILEMLGDVPDFSHEMKVFERLSDFQGSICAKNIDVILLDLDLPDSQGLDTLAKVRSRVQDVPIIVLTGLEDEEIGIRAVREGAQDFLEKNKINSGSLVRCLNYSIERNLLVKELKQKTKEIEDVTKRLHSIIDTNFDGIMIVDQNGNIQFLNPSAMKMLGCRKVEDIVGKPFGRPFSTEERTEVELAGDKGHPVIAEMRVADIFWDGEVASLVILHDITGRKQMEEKMLRLSTAIEQADECIVITDTDARIQYVNPAFEKITGYGGDAVLGKNPRLLSSGKNGRIFYKQLWDTLLSGKTWKGHFINKKKDGSLYEENATITPVKDASGNITNYVAVKRDVTEEIKVQMQLRQAQKMETIGTLAGGIAHDFNNILTVIIGYTDITRQDFPENSMARSNLDEVFNAGGRAKALVNQILAFSRQTEEERRPLQLDQTVREVVAMVRSTLPVTIEVRENIVSRALIRGDSSQIHQIVLNLCMNAAQAMSEDRGRMEVSLEETDIDPECQVQYPVSSSDAFVRLRVKDNGCGMDPSVMERIFDPYFTTKALGEGTGLGLAVTHGIVKSHGGIINVSSEIGRGTTFDVFFPVLASDIKQAVKNSEILLKGHERILFVDDEKVIVDLSKKMLEKLGYTVEATTSSVEALNIFKADPDGFDLVITDMTMPQLTGDMLAKELVQIKKNLPIILCTGFSKKMTKEKAKEIGISAFATKPVFMDQISKIIREVLDPVGLENKSNEGTDE